LTKRWRRLANGLTPAVWLSTECHVGDAYSAKYRGLLSVTSRGHPTSRRRANGFDTRSVTKTNKHRNYEFK